MASLRARIVAGVVLWTIGLFLLASAGVALVWRYAPDTPFIGRTGSVHSLVFHAAPISAVVVVFMVAGALYVRSGLAGITELRARLGAVHDGRETRVGGRHASEVQPLVDDLNALLEHREQAVRRAVAKAGDLAHGLKTPLAVLAREADRAKSLGQADLAASIGQQAERMRRQIEYHLAHARAAASGATPGARCSIKESADGLARTLLRLHADRGLIINVRVPAAYVARVQRADLDEMLGNLLDNACKWARTQVVVDSTLSDTGVALTVDDDGPGLPAAKREAVLQRGVRADEKAPGFGLGLAIISDLAEVYGGSIALADSPLGGLRAVLELPRAATD